MDIYNMENKENNDNHCDINGYMKNRKKIMITFMTLMDTGKIGKKIMITFVTLMDR